ncbi:MAG: hypothetical protein IPK17_39535 [Chloroflexi bacterium]|uniref:hypothetical protein n=1 Tax=Candidatus Flexifilum breve TaxID=3140694 RepID=UPI003135C91C|nr:hypothetical protein [Chloroflexota bacterium]
MDAAYLNAIDTYEKILPQRNALLERINDRQASPKELRFWDEQIVAAGSIIIAGQAVGGYVLVDGQIWADLDHADGLDVQAWNSSNCEPRS